jgi:hypothetical protein
MFKGKEQKEMERKIRIRKSKTVVQSYIMKLEQLQKRVFGQGKEYAKLGEQKMVRSQASKYLALESRIHQAKKLLLLMEEAEIQRELVSVSGSYIQFSKDIINSIAEAPKVGDITKVQVKFEEAMTKVEGIEQALNTVVDAASDGLLAGEAFGDEKIEEVAKLLESEAGADESTVDKEIEKKIKNVEEMMKKQRF